MTLFYGHVAEVLDMQEVSPDLVGIVGRYQVTAETPKKQAFIFYSSWKPELGQEVWLEDKDAEWNGTFWELSRTL